MKIIADATLPNLIELFQKPFEITTYNNQRTLREALEFHDVLLCRSTLKVDEHLLKNTKIQCVATASSGTDHIDASYLNSKNIKLFDAKGSNAHAVADYVTATLAWLEQQGKLTGKKAGVIGVGEVGSRVIERLNLSGYNVCCYDPYRVDNAHSFNFVNFQELLDCDLLCIHANLHQNTPWPSLNLIHANVMSELKHGTTIINASRGGIVNETDLLNTQKNIHYCTDVYSEEPNINPDIVNFATLCTPHIAGHSIEAKTKAIIQLKHQLLRHFGLTSLDKFASHSSHNDQMIKKLNLNSNKSWQNDALSLYNPHHETLILKGHSNKKEAFLSSRRSHTDRHDFAF